MPAYLGALAVILLLGMVLSRVVLLRRRGIAAMKFGEIDKTDFLIPPVMLFYFYLVFAHAFDWPSVATRQLVHSTPMAWAGVAACAAGLLLLLWSLTSFKQSFRVGIDTQQSGRADHVGHFCIQPQSDLRRFRLRARRRIPDFPELDIGSLHRRLCRAGAPPGVTRRGLFESALRSRIFRLLPAGAAVFLRFSRARRSM
jgi:hypothetical protein